MSDLISNLNRIHTTLMGAERIMRNLGSNAEDVVSWCREQTETADRIVRTGKNFYVYKDGVCITINAHSFTVITAHKTKAKIREMTANDSHVLPEFLYQAIHIPEGRERPPREILNEPGIISHIKDFGEKAGDLGVVAEVNGQIVGAAWTRIISCVGCIDGQTPELVISCLPAFRGLGIGTGLMKKLLKTLREKGYRQTSLAAQTDNLRAVKFYKRLGYQIVDEKPDGYGHTDYIMVRSLSTR